MPLVGFLNSASPDTYALSAIMELPEASRVTSNCAFTVGVQMYSRAEHYRRRGFEARQRAAEATDPNVQILQVESMHAALARAGGIVKPIFRMAEPSPNDTREAAMVAFR
jgi:hypothetical protein